MNVGDALPLRHHLVEAAAMIAMADILRDPNPIHLDGAAAAAAGLGDQPINQGPANLGYVVNLLQAVFPNHHIASLTSAYLVNVKEGDLVTAGGHVSRVEEGQIDCDAWLKREDGTLAVTATATLVAADVNRRPTSSGGAA